MWEIIGAFENSKTRIYLLNWLEESATTYDSFISSTSGRIESSGEVLKHFLSEGNKEMQIQVQANVFSMFMTNLRLNKASFMRYQKEIKFKLSQVNAVYFKVWETTLISRFGYAVHWWKSSILRINGLVNRRTLNYTKVDYRKLILRFHSQRKGRAPGCWLPGGWSQRKQLPWPWPQPPNSVCHCQWCFHGSHPPWPPHSITVTALLKGHL